MFCSTIIPTVGRQTLDRAVQSVLDQTLAAADFEVIVVNDSGRPLAAADWQRADRVRLVTTNQRERSVARNTGAAMAKGQYLHFLDDDDWLAPDALAHFWTDGPHEDAAWLYGLSQLVDRRGRPSIKLDHRLEGNCFLQVMAGEWIPLQASLIASEVFFNVGGFNPLLAGPEDIDLLRRVALRHEIARTPAVVAYIERGKEGSTTDYEAHARYSRRAREKILDEPDTFNRLRPSATDAFWSGRAARLYITSMVWNVQRLRLLTAAGRAVMALRACLLAGRDLLSADFLRSVAHPYASETFARGFAQAAAAADRGHD
jgi:glycosyltransferase involved in cell wall biosynthesis